MANPQSQREGFSASSIAGIVIALAMAIALAKLLSAQRLYEPSYHRAPGEAPGSRSAWPTTRPTPMPTFSSNDRSRWATVRSLGDDGTFIVGKRDTFAYILTAVAQTGQTEFFLLSPLQRVGFPKEFLQARVSLSKKAGRPLILCFILMNLISTPPSHLCFPSWLQANTGSSKS